MEGLGAEDWREAFVQSNPSFPDWFVTFKADLESEPGRISQPVLLLWGDADPYSPVAVGERLLALLPDARFHVVAGGHRGQGRTSRYNKRKIRPENFRLRQLHFSRNGDYVDNFHGYDNRGATMTDRLAAASFTITGDRVAPEWWTQYFGVPPDVAGTKGAPLKDWTGQGRPLARRTGVWGIDSEKAVRSDTLEPHLRYLVQRLALPRSDLKAHIESAGAKVRFFCYWVNESGDRVPDVPDDLRAMMEAMGGTVEIDEYR